MNQHVRFIESGEFLTYPKPTGGNSLDRLIERKQMSTKTTFKRIALVVVAALGFGVLTSVAPANAAAATLSSSAATATIGTTNGNQTSVIITATGAIGDVATIYWDKAAADSATGFAIRTVGTTVGTAVSDTGSSFTFSATQGTGGGAESGTVAYTLTTTTQQFRVDYTKATSTGTFKLCTAACTSSNTLWTMTLGDAATTATRAVFGVTTASDVTYASVSSVSVTQSASAGGYVELTAGYEDVAGDATLPKTTLITVEGGTFLYATDTAEYTFNAATVAASTQASVGTAAGGDTFAGNILRIGTPTVGTITVKYITRSVTDGVSTDTTRQTFTINVVTAPTVYSYATSAMTANNQGIVAGDDVLYAPSAASIQVGTVTVAQFSAANVAASAANAKAITATLTGVGSLASATAGAATTYIAIPAATSASYTISIFGTGVAGTGTLVIAVNGVNIKTHTLKFYGAAAKVEATGVYTIGRAGGYVQGVLGSGANDAAGVSVGGLFTTPTVTASSLNDPAIAVLVTDSLGTPVPSAVSVTSSNPAVVLPLTSANSFVDSGDGSYAAGTFYRHYTYETTKESASGQSSTLTFTVALASGLSVSGTTVVKIGGSASTETLSFDKTSYTPGEAMVITRTAKDSAGNPVYDNAAAGAVIFNKAVGGSLGASVYIGGVAYSTQATRPSVFAPAVTGDFEARMTGKVAGSTAAIVAKATVSDDVASAAAQAAADAAAEATDAANAATDAANAAAEAADAATAAAQDAADAVAALSTQVSEMIDALKKQITALTNLVIKIQKKVKA